MASATASAATTDGGGWRRRRRPMAAAAAAAPAAVADVEACGACVEMAVQGHAALLRRLLVREQQQQGGWKEGKQSGRRVAAEMAAWKETAHELLEAVQEEVRFAAMHPATKLAMAVLIVGGDRLPEEARRVAQCLAPFQCTKGPYAAFHAELLAQAALAPLLAALRRHEAEQSSGLECRRDVVVRACKRVRRALVFGMEEVLLEEEKAEQMGTGEAQRGGLLQGLKEEMEVAMDRVVADRGLTPCHALLARHYAPGIGGGCPPRLRANILTWMLGLLGVFGSPLARSLLLALDIGKLKRPFSAEENETDAEQPTATPPKKKRKEEFTWFPTLRHGPDQEGEGKEEQEGGDLGNGDVTLRTPTRQAYVSEDGTALVWDAATLLELRAKCRTLTRSIGMGSVRVSAGQKAIPATLLPAALALAVEDGFLSMAQTAPPTDTDRFDKEALNREQLQMMEEERLARKVRRHEMLQWRAMEEEALALAEQQQADTVGMERSGSLIDLAEAAAAGAAAEAAANTTSDGQLPAVVVEGGNASAMETPLRRLACLQQAAAGAGRGEGEEEEGQGLQKQEGNSGSGMPKATLALVRPLESLRGFHTPEEARLRAVYRDLWERGLTVGCGAPYGADFTAYEGDPLAFHSFAAIVVKDARASLTARELSASVRLEQSVVKLLVYAICHELPPPSSPSSPNEEANDGGGKLLPLWTAPSAMAATTRFGPPRRRVGRFLIEYITLRFITVTRRME